MPELPDVETYRRYVDATSLHQRIGGVALDAERMLQGRAAAELAGRLEGRAFFETARHGKFLFVRLADAAWLVLHFGMTGRLAYGKHEVPAHTRLRVDFENGYHLALVWQRRLGRIDLSPGPCDFARQQRLGPDAFAPGLDRDRFAAMCRGRRGGVKSALMDQSFIAGLGNVYSDEILFSAKLHPAAAAGSLDDGQLAALHRSMREVLEGAVAAHAQPERLPDDWLLPHRHDGGHCPRCGTRLATARIAGRRTWLCPACQNDQG